MVKNLSTHLLEKIVFGLKMGIKSGPSHVGFINNILDSDFAITLAGE